MKDYTGAKAACLPYEPCFYPHIYHVDGIASMPKLEVAFAIGAVLAAVAVGGALYTTHPKGFTNNGLSQGTGSQTSPQSTTTSSVPSSPTANSTSTAGTNSTSAHGTQSAPQTSASSSPSGY